MTGLITIPIKVTARAQQTLFEHARRLGYRNAASYAQILFDAAFAARVQNMRGLPTTDAELDEQVRAAICLAGEFDVAATSRVLGVPESFVKKVRDGCQAVAAAKKKRQGR